MKKYILTRLGMNFRNIDIVNNKSLYIHCYDNENYVKTIIDEMLNFTYYSVKNQTQNDIIWVFLCGDRMTDSHIKNIKGVIKDVEIIFVNFKTYEKTYDKIIEPNSITFRLDADDYMHPTLIEKVSNKLLEKYDGNNIVISNPVHGYKLYPNFNISEFEAPHIALGQGVISKSIINIMHRHTELLNIYKTLYPDTQIIDNIIDSNERLYLYRRHKLAHSFINDKNYNKKTMLNETERYKIFEEFGVYETPYFKNNFKDVE